MYSADPQNFFQWLWGGVAATFAILIGTIWKSADKRISKTEDALEAHRLEDRADFVRLHEKMETTSTDLRHTMETNAQAAAQRQMDLMNVMIEIKGRIK